MGPQSGITIELIQPPGRPPGAKLLIMHIFGTNGRIVLKLKLKLIGANQSVRRNTIKMTSNERQPPMEDNLKIS